MKSTCSNCKRETNQQVLNENKKSYHDDSGWWEEHKYQIIQCKGCDIISFRRLYNDIAQDQGAEYAGFEPWTQELYPKRTAKSLNIKNLKDTPRSIIKIYRETIDAFNNEQTILCSAGLRAIVEGICKDRGIEKGEVTNRNGVKKMSKNLDGKIEALASGGFLTLGNAKILHELRFMGNDALHELASPSLEELKIAIEIVEHTFDNLYELNHKAARLKKEIAKRKS